jgi:dihydropyrimidinase
LDIAVDGEKIVLLAPSGSLKNHGKKVIDAEGGYIMVSLYSIPQAEEQMKGMMFGLTSVKPGGIDCHVHLQEPSLFGKGTSADTYESGTRSAIAGGTTTIVTFAPLQKGIASASPLAVIRDTHALANNNCYSDYSFHLLLATADPQALQEFPQLIRDEGISSIKIYMTYKALQLGDGEILSVLLAARQNQILTMIHAENGDVLDWLTDQLEAAKLFAPRYHSNSRPPILEDEATNRAIALSSLLANTPILLVHVSDPGAALRIRDAQTKGQPVFAETCPQYLFLTRDDLDRPGFEGAKYICSPPPRNKADHADIWRGLQNGTFSILSSDHCPFRFNDSTSGKKSCITAPCRAVQICSKWTPRR